MLNDNSVAIIDMNGKVSLFYSIATIKPHNLLNIWENFVLNCCWFDGNIPLP